MNGQSAPLSEEGNLPAATLLSYLYIGFLSFSSLLIVLQMEALTRASICTAFLRFVTTLTSVVWALLT